MQIKLSTSLGVAAATLLACAGCSAPAADTAATTPKPAPTATVTATATVEASPTANAGMISPGSLRDLRDSLTAQGLRCNHWSITIKNFSGSCDDLLILTWTDPENAKRDKLFQASLALEWQVLRDRKRSDIAILVGQDWSIRLSTQDAKTMQGRVGGVVLHG